MQNIDMLKHENYLNVFAARNKDAIRFKEDKKDYRGEYFKDIDRVIYSLSYLRYSDKTQVFSQINNDHLSKRMIHVQLVSKIARTIGRALSLNEDLIEAASLGHDIGHAPLGHLGESILNNICLKNGLGYFNHNVQSVRSLMYLEKDGNGLNLTLQTLDAILCHNGEIEKEIYKPINKTKEMFMEEYNNCYTDKNQNIKLVPMTLEGCVLRISDIIAYIGRDIEDAIRIGVIKQDDIPSNIVSVLGNNNSKIVDTLITDIIQNSYGKNYIKLSKEKYQALKELKSFNYENIYNKSCNNKQKEYYIMVFNKLFNKYLNDLNNLDTNSNIYKSFYEQQSQEYKRNNSTKRIVVDFIAGMTDDYLLGEYNKYFKM